ncbi:MAG: tRNA (5-methylaminomethyl-2-thiouridine)(34)-methyltransferase MnmD [Rhodobacteraceae bacterium]|nr:tRNA (5-methylaminomethyl-2-thiouridine)(34)-methyltransferase MnmD [Paracoccaceae bacterium]
MPSDQPPALDWTAAGVPVSRRYGDPYFSRTGGLAEAAHVFLAGSDLPARFRPGFAVAELGLGTGLNLVATWRAWRQAGIGGTLHYTGFEEAPPAAAAIARAHAAFPGLGAEAAPLLPLLAGEVAALDLPGLALRLVAGDARLTLPAWPGRADAWFLDGFAPARNPAMWEGPLLFALARASAPGATVATYSAAGHVRRALAAAGFAVARRPGFATKRHMTAGQLRP